METQIKHRSTSRNLPYSTSHVCPECNKEFTGRKNKVFCSIECKIKSNNVKAAVMNYRVSQQVKMLKENARILDELYAVEGIPFQVEKIELVRRGFILNCPTISIKSEDGIEWHEIGDFIFRLVEEGQEVQIMTIADLEKI